MAQLNYENRISLKSVTFGAELEHTGLTRYDSCKTVCETLGCNSNTITHYRDHGLDAYKFLDHTGNVWKVVSDSSVTSAPESCELVTPVLNYKGYEKIHDILEALKSKGAYSNNTCGLHVHVSSQYMEEAATIRKLLEHDYTRYDMIYLATRGFKKWSQPQKRELVESASKMSSVLSIKNLWYKTYAPFESQNEHYNESRYHGLNLHSLFQGKGVEYRYFPSSFEWNEVKAYIDLSRGMLMDAVNSYKMRRYLYVDRPYNKVYDRNNRNSNMTIADCTIIKEDWLYKYSTLWDGYLDRMTIPLDSKHFLLKNFA